MIKIPLLCAVQARASSSRLPQKCFAPLGGRPLLSHVLERCLMMESCSRTALLVPEAEAGLFSAFLEKENLPVELFGGSEEDVLGRFEAAARFFRWEGALMRVTGDNPFIGVFLADRLASEFCGEGIIHYLGNPLGTGVEIFSRSDLSKAFAEAQDPYEREHCTPYFYRNPQKFKVAEPPCPAAAPNIRVTVDTPQDLVYAEALFAAAPEWGVSSFSLPQGFSLL